MKSWSALHWVTFTLLKIIFAECGKVVREKFSSVLLTIIKIENTEEWNIYNTELEAFETPPPNRI